MWPCLSAKVTTSQEDKNTFAESLRAIFQSGLRLIQIAASNLSVSSDVAVTLLVSFTHNSYLKLLSEPTCMKSCNFSEKSCSVHDVYAELNSSSYYLRSVEKYFLEYVFFPKSTETLNCLIFEWHLMHESPRTSQS